MAFIALGDCAMARLMISAVNQQAKLQSSLLQVRSIHHMPLPCGRPRKLRRRAATWALSAAKAGAPKRRAKTESEKADQGDAGKNRATMTKIGRSWALKPACSARSKTNPVDYGFRSQLEG